MTGEVKVHPILTSTKAERSSGFSRMTAGLLIELTRRKAARKSMIEPVTNRVIDNHCGVLLKHCCKTSRRIPRP
jgi:hypothetical protein